jgi:hypothetical protein
MRPAPFRIPIRNQKRGEEGHGDTGHENTGHENTGHENAGHKNALATVENSFLTGSACHPRWPALAWPRPPG